MFERIDTKYGPFFLPFEKPYGVIGIAFSGGLESTILLYILCSRNQPPDHVFYVKDKIGEQMTCATKIIEWINSRFNLNLQIEFMERIGDTHSLKPDMLNCAALVDYIYIATNSQPDLSIDIGVRNLQVRPIANPPAKEPESITKVIEPFKVYDKLMTTFLYRQFNVEELLPMTWSCASSTATQPCGQCFACRDRHWAWTCFYHEK